MPTHLSLRPAFTTPCSPHTEAIEHVGKYRRIDPNPGFMRQLVEFEIELYGGASMRLPRDEEVDRPGGRHHHGGGHGKGKRR